MPQFSVLYCSQCHTMYALPDGEVYEGLSNVKTCPDCAEGNPPVMAVQDDQSDACNAPVFGDTDD